MSIRIPLLSLLLLQSACASHRVIRDRAYEDALNAYRRGEPALSLEKFPHGEDGGMITSLEKSWLDVWTAHWDPEPLQKQVDTFNERHYTSLSREAGYFLFQEAEEGYVPSEHEVIVLHLLSATHFLKLGKNEDAEVELRRAGYVLDHFWDDPALRLWLGTLWASTGRWDEALVDFRRSQELKPSAELAHLLQAPQPRRLTLNFYGVAPTMHWLEGQYTPEFLQGADEPRGEPIRASSLRWFERHEQRNTALRDILVKSNFMAQYLGSKALTGTERGINKSTVWSIKAAAVAFTTALIGGTLYVFSQDKSGASSSGDAIGWLLGGELGLGIALWRGADSLDREMEQALHLRERLKNDDLKIYRVARFLPGWISLSSSREVPAESPDSADHVHLGERVLLVNHY